MNSRTNVRAMTTALLTICLCAVLRADEAPIEPTRFRPLKIEGLENGRVEVASETGGRNGRVVELPPLKPHTDYVFACRVKKSAGVTPHRTMVLFTVRQAQSGRHVKRADFGRRLPADDTWRRMVVKTRTGDSVKGARLFLNVTGKGSLAVEDLSLAEGRTYTIDDLHIDPDKPLTVKTTLFGHDRHAALVMTAGGAVVLDTSGAPLTGETECRVRVDHRPCERGCLLTFEIENATDTPQPAPEIRIDNTAFTRAAVYLNAFKVPGLQRGGKLHPHPYRQEYPGGAFSPLTGVGENGMYLGAALLYDVTDEKHIVALRNEYLKKRSLWRIVYRPLGPWDAPDPKKTVAADMQKFRSTQFGKQPPPLQLAPGETRRYVLALQAAPLGEWKTAYSRYRDFFRETYGDIRYKKDPRPIAGYGYDFSGRYRKTEMVEGGWTPFVDHFVEERIPRGWRRAMVWFAAPGYVKHRGANQPFEIATGQTEACKRTAPQLKKLYEKGVILGFWMGRAGSVSKGYDLGYRWPIDLDAPDDVKAWRREVDRARQWGVRMIGFDATCSSDHPWSPTPWYNVTRFFPFVKKHYPDMQLVFEGPSDLEALWGGCFVLDRDIAKDDTPALMEYIVPGIEVDVWLNNVPRLRFRPWLVEAMKPLANREPGEGATIDSFKSLFEAYGIERVHRALQTVFPRINRELAQKGFVPFPMRKHEYEAVVPPDAGPNADAIDQWDRQDQVPKHTEQ